MQPALLMAAGESTVAALLVTLANSVKQVAMSHSAGLFSRYLLKSGLRGKHYLPRFQSVS